MESRYNSQTTDAFQLKLGTSQDICPISQQEKLDVIPIKSNIGTKYDFLMFLDEKKIIQIPAILF